MIYLPHPNFKFEGSEGGGCVGYLNPDNKIKDWVKQFSHLGHYNVDLDKLISKFDKYRSYYWDGVKRLERTSISFGFLREDGNEVAIRVIENAAHDLVGYWRPSLPLERFFRGKDNWVYKTKRDLLDPLMEYLEKACPVE
jgi:hypothetical protein